MDISKSEPGIRNSPTFLISIDFELFWGVLNTRTIANYGKNILGARFVIPKLLDLFKAYEIRATWAVVGMLLFDNKKDLIAHLPENRPAYQNDIISPYDYLDKIGDNEKADPYHYGRSLTELIVRTPGMELASHTFSHYFCLERGQTANQFRSDLHASIAAIKRITNAPESIVFPRNQVNIDYLPICCEVGFKAYRGNPRHWAYGESGKGVGSSLRRLFRAVDTYIPFSGPNGVEGTVDSVRGSDGEVRQIVDACASRFFRPTANVSGIEDFLKRRRIMVSMDAAFKDGHSYHIWFHPHNFGAHPEKNLEAFEDVLRHFAKIREKTGVTSLTMAEFAENEN